MSDFISTPEQDEIQPIGPKTAVVAIVGRPSAGKSTFLNTASGEKISIVSPIPQTTRNAVRGIVNTSLGQLVFVDTPGYHDSEKKLNLKLKGIAAEQLDSADVILYIIDSTRAPGKEEELTAALKSIIAEVGASTPQEMGKVMGVATKKLAGMADGKAISAKVRELLA